MTMKRQFLFVTVGMVVALIIITMMLNQVTNKDNTIELAPVVLDDFNGSELSSKWRIQKNWNGTILVSNGLLTLVDGTHKRIDSNIISYNTNSTLTLSTRVMLSGYYQKFGFNINPTETQKEIGIYFDTFCPPNIFCSDKNSTLTTDENLVYYFIKNKNGTVLEQGEAAIQYNQYHILKIVIEPDQVSFLVDDILLEKAKYTYEGPLVIGIWNDRAPAMKVDWVLFEMK